MNQQSKDIIERIVQRAAASYDPMRRVEVKGPFEGLVSFSDGSIYCFQDGKALVHRKNLYEAYNIGCWLTRGKEPTPLP